MILMKTIKIKVFKAETMNCTARMLRLLTLIIVMSNSNKALQVKKLKILLAMFLKKQKKNFFVQINQNKAALVTIITAIYSNYR